MRAVRVKVIGPERQKQRKTILLLKSVSLKMSESEHSDSEFYYPGELLGNENAAITYSQRSNRKKVTTPETKQCCRVRPRSTKE